MNAEGKLMTDDEKMREDAHKVILTMRRVRLALTHGLNKRLAPSGINFAQFGAMALVHKLNNPTMSVLTEELGTTMGAVTSLIDRLVFSAYVERSRSETDRRVVNITLTEKGEEVLNHYLEWGADFIVEYFNTVEPDDMQTFMRIFEELVDSITKHMSED